MKVAFLTSGGDCQGMNTCIKYIVENCYRLEWEPIAVNKGYQGLIDNNFSHIELKDVENIGCLGGSIIKSYRSKEFMTAKGFDRAVENLKKNKIDHLIIIGGDGSLLGMRKLVKKGISASFIPGTIDNDVVESEMTLGFDTAVNNAVYAIDKIKQTIDSVDRGVVIEVMGRNCPNLALNVSKAVNADLCLHANSNLNYNEIPEQLKDLELIHNPVIVLQENCIDREKLAEKLQNEFDIEYRTQSLGYIQRGGAPSVSDRILAYNFVNTIFNNLIEGQTSNFAVIVKNNLVKKIKI